MVLFVIVTKIGTGVPYLYTESVTLLGDNLIPV